MNAVLLGTEDGSCTPVTVKRSERGNWTMGRTKLFLHHHVCGIAMLSPLDVRHMQSAHVEPFEYALPPPLDAYVYPEKLIVARYDHATHEVRDLTAQDFVDMCTKLIASSQCTDDVEAVYDVPAIPINYDEEEDADYGSDENGNEILADSNDEEEEETDEEEEEEWDDDDDAISAV